MDSFEANLKYFQSIFARAGYRKPTKSAYREVFHKTFADILTHFTGQEQREELERLQEIGAAEPYPMHLLNAPRGAKEAVRSLARNYKLGIVSNRRHIGIERYFTFAKTKQYFTVVIGCESSQNHKPHPEPLLLAAKRLGVRPSECVYIGDSPTDIEAGKAARMKTILYGGKKHKDANASTKMFKKLPEIIDSLNPSSRGLAAPFSPR
jgi:HAD superfamily hydrolase (TIGR01549 family)